MFDNLQPDLSSQPSDRLTPQHIFFLSRIKRNSGWGLTWVGLVRKKSSLDEEKKKKKCNNIIYIHRSCFF